MSWLHGEVSKKMFAGIWKGYAPEESHVGFVTNGVHMPTWAASEWKVFYNKVLGDDFLEHQELESAWAPLMNVPDEKIWEMRMTLKQKFIRFVKRDFKESWLKNQGDPTRIANIVDKINPDALLVVLPPISVPTSSSTTWSVSRRLSTMRNSPFSSFSPVRHIPPMVPVRA